MKPPFRRVVLDERAKGLPFAEGLLEKIPADMPVESWLPEAPRPQGRSTLFVTVEQGAFLKQCPCTPGAVRCGYHVFTLGFQCPLNCSYCFLRFYAPDEPLTLYANLEDAAREFCQAAAGWGAPVRVGTGEFTDSLALDSWTGHAGWLYELVARFPNALLELKTKTARVERLLELKPLPNLIAAWSVNPVNTVASQEPDSACLDERLAAARAVAEAGYRVAFHFDPVILADDPGQGGWRAGYADVVRRIAEAVPVHRVAWISLGTLRFPQRFLDAWGPRLRGNPIFFDEFTAGEDGKLRYFWPLRREAYRLLAAEIHAGLGSKVPVYLCMESPAMWRAGLGWEPTEEALARRLSESA
jgi:spore photoproduct lyase